MLLAETGPEIVDVGVWAEAPKRIGKGWVRRPPHLPMGFGAAGAAQILKIFDFRFGCGQ